MAPRTFFAHKRLTFPRLPCILSSPLPFAGAAGRAGGCLLPPVAAALPTGGGSCMRPPCHHPPIYIGNKQPARVEGADKALTEMTAEERDEWRQSVIAENRGGDLASLGAALELLGLAGLSAETRRALKNCAKGEMGAQKKPFRHHHQQTAGVKGAS